MCDPSDINFAVGQVAKHSSKTNPTKTPLNVFWHMYRVQQAMGSVSVATTTTLWLLFVTLTMRETQ
jgi:hypothetical protein